MKIIINSLSEYRAACEEVDTEFDKHIIRQLQEAVSNANFYRDGKLDIVKGIFESYENQFNITSLKEVVAIHRNLAVILKGIIASMTTKGYDGDDKEKVSNHIENITVSIQTVISKLKEDDNFKE